VASRAPAKASCTNRTNASAEVIGATVGRIATGRAAVAYNGAGALVLVDR
jgi:hypothetical protein